jgi:hypothetical protein
MEAIREAIRGAQRRSEAIRGDHRLTKGLSQLQHLGGGRSTLARLEQPALLQLLPTRPFLLLEP